MIVTGIVTAAAPKTKVLVFWHGYTQGPRREVLAKTIKAFEAEHPGVTVREEAMPWEQMNTKWTTAQAAGTLPDVAAVLFEQSILMAEAKASYPTDSVVKMLGGPDYFVRQQLDNCFYKGHYIAVPHYTHCRLLFYREDWLKEAGVSAPKTWDEFLAVAKAVTKPPQRYAMVQAFKKGQSTTAVLLDCLVKTNGGEFFDKKWNLKFNTPQVVEAVKFILELNKYAPPGSLDYDMNSINELFLKDKVAFVINSPFVIQWTIESAPHILPYLKAVPIPQNKCEGWMTEMQSLVLPKGKNPKEAREFMAFLLRKDQYIPFAHTVPGGIIPTVKAVAQSEEYWNHPTIKRFREIIDLALYGVSKGTPVGLQHGPSKYGAILRTGVIEEMFQSILIQGLTPEQAVAKTHARLQEEIDRMKKRG